MGSLDTTSWKFGTPLDLETVRFHGGTATRLAIGSGLIALYFVTGRLGLHLAVVNPSATAIWAPAGISVAACIIFGSWVGVAVFAGAFLVNVTVPGSVLTALAIATGNTLEALTGAYLVSRFANGRRTFDKTSDAIKFLILAAILSTILSPSVGVTSLCLAGYAKWSAYRRIWLTWWLGDAAGDLIVAPVLILWSAGPSLAWSKRQTLEAVLLLISLTLAGGVMFGGWLPSAAEQYPLEFLGLPILLWAAFRFGQREAATALFLLVTIAIFGTVYGHGPYSRVGINEALLLLQTSAGLTALMVIAVGAEVAQRRRLDENRAGVAAIVDASNDAIVGHALDGKITSWNASAERTYGFSSREALGQPITSIIPPGRWSEEEQMLARVLSGEVVDPFETVRRRKNGDLVDISLTISTVRNSSGEIIGTSRIGRDITEQKRIRREREALLHSEQTAREAAEAAGRAKDEFVAMLAHELRNPLHAISLALPLLDSAGTANSASRAQGIIARQTEHLSRMVDDLLEVARVTTGKIVLARRPIDLAETVAQCISTARETRQLERHLVQTELESVWVGGDADRIDQVVTNLINNATKFTPEGGSIDISVKPEGQEAVIRVGDNGVGIAADVLPRIFDLFARGDLGLNRAPSGLGLGLTLVKRLVELHGGSVEASSAGPGLGSTFVLRLPRIAAPALRRLEPQMILAGTSATRRILIVEDNEDARDSLRDFLKMSGHDIYEAEDGPGGVQVALSVQPDIALIDIGLPGFDGYEVAARIRSSAAGAKTRLIAVSGYGQYENRVKAKQVGFDEYLVKPVDSNQLVELISTLSSNGSA